MSDEKDDHAIEGIWSFIILMIIILLLLCIIFYNMYIDDGSGLGIGLCLFFIFVFLLIWIFVFVGKLRHWPAAENSCRDDPCLHDGECENEYFDGYNCTCTENWTGNNCSEASDNAIHNRPCERDNPCYHSAECTDTDENSDGIFEDYECGTNGLCPLIEGNYDEEKRWTGKNCNDFPDGFDNKYNSQCFKDVEGKTEKEKRPWVKCTDPKECMHYQNMKTNCKTECNLDTNIWCDDNDFEDPCISETDSSKLDTCKTYRDFMFEEELETDVLENELYLDNLIRECNNDISTNWIKRECQCTSGFNCSDITDMNICKNSHCCKVESNKCKVKHNEGYIFSDKELDRFYHRGNRHNNIGKNNPGSRSRSRFNYRNNHLRSR